MFAGCLGGSLSLSLWLALISPCVDGPLGSALGGVKLGAAAPPKANPSAPKKEAPKGGESEAKAPKAGESEAKAPKAGESEAKAPKAPAQAANASETPSQKSAQSTEPAKAAETKDKTKNGTKGNKASRQTGMGFVDRVTTWVKEKYYGIDASALKNNPDTTNVYLFVVAPYIGGTRTSNSKVLIADETLTVAQVLEQLRARLQLLKRAGSDCDYSKAEFTNYARKPLTEAVLAKKAMEHFAPISMDKYIRIKVPSKQTSGHCESLAIQLHEAIIAPPEVPPPSVPLMPVDMLADVRTELENVNYWRDQSKRVKLPEKTPITNWSAFLNEQFPNLGIDQGTTDGNITSPGTDGPQGDPAAVSEQSGTTHDTYTTADEGDGQGQEEGNGLGGTSQADERTPLVPDVQARVSTDAVDVGGGTGVATPQDDVGGGAGGVTPQDDVGGGAGGVTPQDDAGDVVQPQGGMGGTDMQDGTQVGDMDVGQVDTPSPGAGATSGGAQQDGEGDLALQDGDKLDEEGVGQVDRTTPNVTLADAGRQQGDTSA